MVELLSRQSRFEVESTCLPPFISAMFPEKKDSHRRAAGGRRLLGLYICMVWGYLPTAANCRYGRTVPVVVRTQTRLWF